MDRLDLETQADNHPDDEANWDDLDGEIAEATERDEIDPQWKAANDKLGELYCAWNDGKERINAVCAEVFYEIEQRYTELAALLDQLNPNPLDA